MKLKIGLLSAGALALALGFSAPAWSAGYLKIGDIKGEATASPSKGEQIDVLSWSWGETSAAPSTGLATGKRMHKPFVITKQLDKSSPMLQQAAANGTIFDHVDLVLAKPGAGRQEYMKYELKNVMISSYQTGGSSGGQVPTETISLNYEEIKQTYASQEEKAKAQGETKEMKYKTKDEGDR